MTENVGNKLKVNELRPFLLMFNLLINSEAFHYEWNFGDYHIFICLLFSSSWN